MKNPLPRLSLSQLNPLNRWLPHVRRPRQRVDADGRPAAIIAAPVPLSLRVEAADYELGEAWRLLWASEPPAQLEPAHEQLQEAVRRLIMWRNRLDAADREEVDACFQMTRYVHQVGANLHRQSQRKDGVPEGIASQLEDDALKAKGDVITLSEEFHTFA